MGVAEINDKTKVQLYAVFGVLPVFVGLISWLTVLYLKADAAEKMNEKQDVKIESQSLLLLDIRDRVIRIEANQRPKGE